MHRVALVIGNSNYLYSKKLKNPKNDAEDMAKELSQLGFEVKKLLDVTHNEMIIEIKDFVKNALNFSATFLYFAGHGIQIDGNNYILPTDFDFINKETAILNSYCMNEYLKDIGVYSDKTNIIVLDSCRNNPFVGKSRGFMSSNFESFSHAPKGCFISFSTSPDEVANDGFGNNGLYTGILKEFISTPNIQIEETFKLVRTKLDKISGSSQMSWEHSSLIGNFYFKVIETASAIDPIEVFNFIKEQGDIYEKENNKNIYEVECLPYIDAQREFGLPIIELARIYSKEAYSREGKRFSDSDIDEINIRYLSSWGFEYRDFRWYFKNEYIKMGDPLPLEPSRIEKSPEVGKSITVDIIPVCTFSENKLYVNINNNLPDETILMISLRNKKIKYSAQSKTKNFNFSATSDGFTNRGEKLVDGLYELNISSPIYSVQSQNVKKVFGEGNVNLSGKYVKYTPLMGKTIDSFFTVIIEGDKIKVFE